MSGDNKKPRVRCPWCGKHPAPTKRGRLASHVTPGNKKCLGVGQPINQAAWLQHIKAGAAVNLKRREA